MPHLHPPDTRDPRGGARPRAPGCLIRRCASARERRGGDDGARSSRANAWLIGLAAALVIAGQLYYLPQRIEFWSELRRFADAPDRTAALRLAYDRADYDLLEWVKQHSAPDATILLVTSSPRVSGGGGDFLFHRALYHLYPRTVWWAAPVPATEYPTWWIPTDLSAADLRAQLVRRHATLLLADGFPRPPLRGTALAFDRDTWLISPGGAP